MWEWFWSLGEKGNKWIYQYVKNIPLRAFLLYKPRANMWTLLTTYPIIYLVLLSKNTHSPGMEGGNEWFCSHWHRGFYCTGETLFPFSHATGNAPRIAKLSACASVCSPHSFRQVLWKLQPLSNHNVKAFGCHWTPLEFKKKQNKTNPLCFCRLGCD